MLAEPVPCENLLTVKGLPGIHALAAVMTTRTDLAAFLQPAHRAAAVHQLLPAIRRRVAPPWRHYETTPATPAQSAAPHPPAHPVSLRLAHPVSSARLVPTMGLDGPSLGGAAPLASASCWLQSPSL